MPSLGKYTYYYVCQDLSFIMSQSRGKKHGGNRRGGRRRVKGGGKHRGGARFQGRRRVKGGGGKTFKAVIGKLKKLSPGLQVQAMRSANNRFIRCMCSAVRKLKNKRLSSKVTAGMHRNAKKIRKLISPKTSIRAKRRMLSHKGGFLPLLLAGLGGSLVSSLLGGIAGNR